MTKLLRRYGVRFNALSLRERALVAAALLVVLAFAMYSVFIAPQIRMRGGLEQQAAQQDADLAALRAQLQSLAAQLQDPDAPLRARLGEARAQIARIDGSLKALERKLVPPQKVSALLQELLARKQGLRLVSLRTLPAAGLVERKDNSASRPAQAGGDKLAAPLEGGIYKHGVEITLQGGYRDLQAYLAELERLPQQVFWSHASLRADYPLSTLTVTVFTLSLERTWLTV